MGLFGKKQDKNSEPPLPDNLPPLDSAPPVGAPGSVPPIQPNITTHDQIPNDIQLNPPVPDMPPPTQPSMGEPLINNNSFAPHPALGPEQGMMQKTKEQKLPEPNIPNPDTFSAGVPGNVEAQEPDSLPDLPEIDHSSTELPELPDIKDIPNPRPQSQSAAPTQIEEPRPQVDDEVPTPPPIFSDEEFYETPNEIRHLVNEKKIKHHHHKPKQLFAEEHTYVHEDVEDDIPKEAPGKEGVEGGMENYHQRPGPIFINIDAFKGMLGDIETIQKDIKSSELILQHLQEIKNAKDMELERWRVQLENIQKKVTYVDKVLFNEA